MCKLKRAIVIGSLWSITDGDADLMTFEFMKVLDKVYQKRELEELIKGIYKA